MSEMENVTFTITYQPIIESHYLYFDVKVRWQWTICSERPFFHFMNKLQPLECVQKLEMKEISKKKIAKGTLEEKK